MNKGKILITDTIHEYFMTEMRSQGFECDYLPEISQEDVTKCIKPYVGLVVNSKINIDKALIDVGENLKFVGRIGSGMEKIDTIYCTQKGIACLSAPEGNGNAVAEFALGILLSLTRKIVQANTSVKQKKWLRETHRGIELKDKTIGIIGFGNTGSAFAKKLAGFDMHILVYDKYKKIKQDGVKQVEMQTIFEEADIISLHIPLTEETKFQVNIDWLSQFKKPIYLINTSRGKVVKTCDIITAFENEKLLGLALDVLENEKLKSFTKDEYDWFETLISNNKIILSPHIAGWTVESKFKVAQILADKIKFLCCP